MIYAFRTNAYVCETCAWMFMKTAEEAGVDPASQDKMVYPQAYNKPLNAPAFCGKCGDYLRAKLSKRGLEVALEKARSCVYFDTLSEVPQRWNAVRVWHYQPYALTWTEDHECKELFMVNHLFSLDNLSSTTMVDTLQVVSECLRAAEKARKESPPKQGEERRTVRVQPVEFITVNQSST